MLIGDEFMCRKSFIVYSEWLYNLSLLTDAQSGVLFRALLAYSNETELPEMDNTTAMCFSFMKAQIDRDNEKYEQVCAKRSEAGKKSAEKRWGTSESVTNVIFANDEVTSCNYNDNVDNNVDVNENDNKNKKKDKPVKHKYGSYGRVLLSDDEYEKLKTEFPYNYQYWIDRVDSYCESHGVSYKNYLATIRNWSKSSKEQTFKYNAVNNGMTGDAIVTKQQKCVDLSNEVY